MRISDWSSDVCSSDLQRLQRDINLGATSLAFFDISRCSSKGLAVGSQSFVDAIDVRLSAFPAILYDTSHHTSVAISFTALNVCKELDAGDRKSTRLNSSH